MPRRKKKRPSKGFRPKSKWGLRLRATKTRDWAYHARMLRLSLLGAFLMAIALELWLRGMACLLYPAANPNFVPPFTGHWLWIWAAWLLLLWALLKLHADGERWFLLAITCLVCVVPFTVLLEAPLALGIMAQASPYRAVESRVSLVTQRQEGSRFPAPVYPLRQGLIFATEDPAYPKHVAALRHSNAYVGTKPYLFWQTAMAKAYVPTQLPAYQALGSPPPTLALLVTVGPLVVLESAVWGLDKHFVPLLLLLGAFFLITRRHLFDEEALQPKYESHRIR